MAGADLLALDQPVRLSRAEEGGGAPEPLGGVVVRLTARRCEVGVDGTRRVLVFERGPGGEPAPLTLGRECWTLELPGTLPPPFQVTGPFETRGGAQHWRVSTAGDHRELHALMKRAWVPRRAYVRPVLTGDRVTAGGYYEVSAGQLERLREDARQAQA